MQLEEGTIKPSAREKSYNYWRLVFERLKKHRIAMVSLVFLIVLILMTLFAKPLSFGNDPFTYISSVSWSERAELAPPGPGHILGLDNMARDVWSRLLYGGRISLFVGIFCSIISATISFLLGVSSGYFGGKLDEFLMRFTDIMLSIPTLPIMIVLSAVIRGSLFTIVLIITAFGWMQGARLVRGETLKIKNEEYIQATHALGLSTVRIIFVHILPNVLAPLIVTTTLAISGNILQKLTFISGCWNKPPTFVGVIC